MIDAGVGGNDARFINHACRPNCYIHILDGTIWIRAARKIRRGEELTYHYNTDGEGLIKCDAAPAASTCCEPATRLLPPRIRLVAEVDESRVCHRAPA